MVVFVPFVRLEGVGIGVLHDLQDLRLYGFRAERGAMSDVCRGVSCDDSCVFRGMRGSSYSVSPNGAYGLLVGLRGQCIVPVWKSFYVGGDVLIWRFSLSALNLLLHLSIYRFTISLLSIY